MNQDDSNRNAKEKEDTSPFAEITWDESDGNWDESLEQENMDQLGGLHEPSPQVDIFGGEDGFGSDSDTSQMDDMWKSVSPGEIRQTSVHYKKPGRKKREFNPWRAMDKAAGKTVSRRDLLRGLFRFLPQDDDK